MPSRLRLPCATNPCETAISCLELIILSRTRGASLCRSRKPWCGYMIAQEMHTVYGPATLYIIRPPYSLTWFLSIAFFHIVSLFSNRYFLTRYNVTPVSYTHLDVYKRQVQDGTRNMFQIRKNNIWGKININFKYYIYYIYMRTHTHNPYLISILSM